jgi:hypothetical protein
VKDPKILKSCRTKVGCDKHMQLLRPQDHRVFEFLKKCSTLIFIIRDFYMEQEKILFLGFKRRKKAFRAFGA